MVDRFATCPFRMSVFNLFVLADWMTASLEGVGAGRFAVHACFCRFCSFFLSRRVSLGWGFKLRCISLGPVVQN